VGETRRRGAALEREILDAAWAELCEVGYTDLTMAGVAARADAAKSVLYRRWPDKAELVRAVVARRVPRLSDPVRTGELRTDVPAVLDSLIAAVREVRVIGDLELSAWLRRKAEDEAIGRLTEVLIAADIDPATISTRVLRLPVDLLVHDLLTGSGETDPAEITDQLFLPLLRLSRE
jgi:AcrR family transcriptional regulator